MVDQKGFGEEKSFAVSSKSIQEMINSTKWDINGGVITLKHEEDGQRCRGGADKQTGQTV
jgi:hypothetical protein